MTRVFALSLAAVAVVCAVADETTLVVPFVDPQAISAKVIGVDAGQARTTYELAQGAYTGTWTDPQGSFPGTATLVEGADYASFTYVVNDREGSFTAGGVCNFANGQETCVAVEADSAGPVTVTHTDAARPFGLQILPATGTPAPSQSNSSPNPAKSNSGGASNTNSAGGSAPSSPSPNAANRLTAIAPILGAVVGALLVLA
ncbi:hypothetical protein MIND_01101700 [Mycena indigotica]|uniref:Uncharacterized protein n=1 Tax=Mycena indigotica TaxID=2126181 RepID=A0A8H6SBC6_9AGAR|nr:uncharacterized protein MIND_01101700 [Mycena indigotica]KAF7295616.1 hypothetical protein MIND_01101700 [Mycena indigotica]